MRPIRIPRALLCLLVLAMMEAPLVSAYHQGGGIDVEPGEPRAPGTGIPATDSLRDDVVARQAEAVRSLNEFLLSQGLPRESLFPDVPANVFRDRVHANGRVGGIGPYRTSVPDTWRVHVAENGSVWTMIDPATGRYATMDALLVLPAIDLSAYPLQTGAVPFIGGDTGPDARSVFVGGCSQNVPQTTLRTHEMCVGLSPLVPSVSVIQDQINLIFRHRYNLFEGLDGGQVLLYERDPLQAGATPILLLPQIGIYAPDVESLDVPGRSSSGYTGSAGWRTESFDLTPWAGKKVWIAFRVATSPQATADPEGNFAPGRFPDHLPFGWAIDDIEVVSPAYPVNLKVVSITGPTFREREDGLRVVAPGTNVTVGAEVLHAGAVRRLSRVTLTVEGAGPVIERTFLANLSPGEVFTPNVTLEAPPSGTLRVRAVAANPGPADSTHPDATLEDNELVGAFDVRAVPRLRATLRPSQSMVDDDQDVDARAVVWNDGNVPLDGSVLLTEAFGPLNASTYRVVGIADLALAPGANATYEWPLPASPRGEHRILLNLTTTQLPPQNASAAYYVHAAPPPVFNATSWPPVAEWNASIPDYPIPPEDDWVWVANSSSRVKPVLRATPLPEAIAAGGRFTDLRLTARYMAVQNVVDTRLDLQYVNPLYTPPPTAGIVVPSIGTSFWSMMLPMSPSNAPGPLRGELGLEWRSIDVPIDPQASDGYPGTWTAAGPELKITAGVRDLDMGNSRFYLDDLRITGVPVGRDASARMDIIRITGAEPSPRATVPRTASESTQAGVAAPAAPSVCRGEASLPDMPNCWAPRHRSQLEGPRYADLHWQNRTASGLPLTFPDGGPAVYTYRWSDGSNKGRPAERLVSPVFRFSEVVHPRLDLETLYAFPGSPYDQLNAQTPRHQIQQVGYVELQYRRDDGEWSDMIRIRPIGGYHSTIERSPPPLSMPRDPQRSDVHYLGTDGLHHPSPCVDDVSTICDARGYHLNRATSPAYTQWVDFGPYRKERLTFNLSEGVDVNLSYREVRLGFHASTMYGAGNCPWACDTIWALRDIRVTSVSTFAIDAAVENLTLDVPYDWRAIGIGPGTVVPVNVTVRNVGAYAERFSLTLSVNLFNGGEVASETVEVGQLAPGEARSVIVPWTVPLAEGRLYVLGATVRPVTGADEKPFDDRLALGEDGALKAETRMDVQISGNVQPSRGRETLARRMPIVVRNAGNVPLSDLEVSLNVEQQLVNAREVKRQVTWRLAEPLAPSAAPTDVTRLPMVPDLVVTDLYYTPTAPGDYLATFRVDGRTLADRAPGDNIATVQFSAVASLFEEDFEQPLPWATNAPAVWGEGPGLHSPRGLLAANRTSGTLPARTDTWIVTPPVPLSNAMAAVVNAFIKYDLERGYDGARLEVSKDGETWHPVEPMGDSGSLGTYPERLAPSSPLSTGPLDRPAAYSGDSRTVPFQLDGWTPVSFDLQDVPALRESVSFRDLRAPAAALDQPLRDLGGGRYGSDAMVLDPSEDTARWEIQNLTDDFAAPSATFWWSGRGSTGGAVVVSTLVHDFDLSEGGAADPIVLSWWDWRAGTVGTSWQGISGKYVVELQQQDVNEAWVPVSGALEVGTPVDGWYPMRLPAREELLDRTRPLRVSFVLESTQARASDLGWGIDLIVLASERVEDGAIQRPHVFTKPDGAADPLWIADRWSQVSTLASRPAPWTIATQQAADGTDRPLWRAEIAPGTHANSDARLVSPAVDLAEVGGTRIGLRLTHSYDLLHDEAAIRGSHGLGQLKSYRAGTVEVQLLNRTTGQWDPWKQVFATGKAPVEAKAARPVFASYDDGAPYPATLVEAGDTFQRYPRTFEQTVRVSGSASVYLREYTANLSYAYAGTPPTTDFMEDEFDLSRYAGEVVRFGFHAYAGARDPENKVRHWTIDNAQVVGYVLSSPDVQLRWRLATDDSILAGEFAVDQMEVAGRRYARSIGIALDPVRTLVEPNGNVIVSGTLTNYGTEARRLVAVGVRESRAPNSPFREVVPLTDRPGTTPAGWAAASGPFELAPAGQEGSTAEFAFIVGVARHAGHTHNLTLDVLEARVQGGALAYREVVDDVPGRARRSLDLRTLDKTEALVTSLAFEPSTLAAPGPATLEGVGRNSGTREIDLTLEATWLHAGQVLTTTEVAVGRVAAGDAFAFRMPPVDLPEEGNYTVRVEGAGLPRVDSYYRVGRSDVNLTESFDDTLGTWAADGLFRISDDDAAFGNASVLFGYNNSLFLDGKRQLAGEGGTLVSPPLDLTHTAKERRLSFWHKPLLRSGVVDVFVDRFRPDMTLDPSCSAQQGLNLTRLGGRADRWEFVTLALRDWGEACSLEGVKFQVRFVVHERTQGQGWRLDGLTVGSGALSLAQAHDDYEVTDSAAKLYPIVLHNPGHVPKDVVLGVDRVLSRLSPAQHAWLTVTPRTLRIEPGANATAVVRVDTPAARGAFPQDLDVVVAATDLAAPYAPATLRLALDFRPLPRQDLNVAASVDGKPLGVAGADVEEAVPHEISVAVTNQGTETSLPVDVRMEVVDDATGRTLWTLTRAIGSLGRYDETEEAVVVSGSWKPLLGARGNHTLRIVVDPDRRLVDYDRSNDNVALPIAVVRLIRPDLAIDERTFAVTTPAGLAVHEAVPGQLVRISAAVTNEGFADARDVTLRILAGASILKEEVVPVLRPGQTHLLRANQFAPNATVVYRVLAFTPDLELVSENNERTVELPVFPAEVRIDADAPDPMDPGATRVVNVTVADDGPYPLTLRLDVKGNAPLARLDRAQLALGPGETQPVQLRLAAAPDERAGTHLVVVRALDEDGMVRAQRTLPVRVAERPAASILPHVARGPPGDLLVQLDAINTGNVPLDASVVVRAADGTVLARAPIDRLPQGGRDLVTLRAALDATTPPGRIPATVEVVREETRLASLPVDLDVLPWSDLDVQTDAREDGGFDVRVAHQGNAAATRDVVLLDVPPGVDARPSQTRLVLEPGENASFSVRVAPGQSAPNGLFRFQLALMDPDAPGAAEPQLASLALDLRAARVEVGDVRRDAEAPVEGKALVYRVLVRNDGAKDATGAPIELYVDGLLMDRVEVPALPPGQTTTVELRWDARPGGHGIVIAVDAHGPLGRGVPAFTERVEVAGSIVPGAGFARELPVPWTAWLLLAMLAVALARRRTTWRP